MTMKKVLKTRETFAGYSREPVVLWTCDDKRFLNSSERFRDIFVWTFLWLHERSLLRIDFRTNRYFQIENYHPTLFRQTHWSALNRCY